MCFKSVVVDCFIDGVTGLCHHFFIHRAEFFRSIEGNDRNAVFDTVQNAVIRHDFLCPPLGLFTKTWAPYATDELASLLFYMFYDVLQGAGRHCHIG